MRCSQYLAGFRGGALYPTVPREGELFQPSFKGTINDLDAEYPDAKLRRTLYNDVKVCPKCSKPCAFTLMKCNSCGTDIKDVMISKSDNVFSAFLFGVKTASKGFPYTVSLRKHTVDVMIFDDMLALTPIHLNGISAKYYIPDWRFLLSDPPAARRLLEGMEEELWNVTESQYLENEAFWNYIYPAHRLKPRDVRSKVIKSFNFPPSQFQMHIQWVVPPLFPFQHHMAEIRNHFHEDRAFPFDYVMEILKLNIPYPTCIKDDTPISEIVEFYDKQGVVYKDHWHAFYEKALADSIECSNWNPEEFEYLVHDGKAHSFSSEGGCLVPKSADPSVNTADIQKKDCQLMQNYGRPYGVDGRPTGTYVKHALMPHFGPGGMQEWPGVFAEPSLWDRANLCKLFCGR